MRVGSTRSSAVRITPCAPVFVLRSCRSVTREFAALLREYRIREVTGDAYAAQWTEEAFKVVGTGQRPAMRWAKPNSQGSVACVKRVVSPNT